VTKNRGTAAIGGDLRKIAIVKTKLKLQAKTKIMASIKMRNSKYSGVDSQG
jgi:hypothetical protein